MRRFLFSVFILLLLAVAIAAAADVPQERTISWLRVYNQSTQTFFLSDEEYSGLTGSNITFTPRLQNKTYNTTADFQEGRHYNTTATSNQLQLDVTTTWEYDQDFDGLANGDLNGQDGWAGDARFDVGATQPYGGVGKDLEHISADAANAGISRAVTQSEETRFEVLQRKVAINADFTELYVYEGANAIGSLYTQDAGCAPTFDVCVNTAGGIVGLVDHINANEWYKYVIETWQGGGGQSHVSYYIYHPGNDSLLASKLNQQAPNDMVAGGVNKIEIKSKTAADTDHFWDNVNYNDDNSTPSVSVYNGTWTNTLDLSNNTTVTNLTVNTTIHQYTNVTVNMSFSRDNLTWYNGTKQENFTTNGSNTHEPAYPVEARYVRFNITLDRNDSGDYLTPVVDWVNISFYPTAGYELNGVWVNHTAGLNNTTLLDVDIGDFAAGTNRINFTGIPDGATEDLYNASMLIGYTVPLTTSVSDFHGYIWKNSTGPFSTATNVTFTFDRVSPYYNISVFVNDTYTTNITNLTDYSNHTDGNFTITDYGDPLALKVWGLIGHFELNISVDFRMYSVIVKDETDNSDIPYTVRCQETGKEKTAGAGVTTHFNGTEVENIVEGDGYSRFNISRVGYGTRIYEYSLGSYTDTIAYLVSSSAGSYITFQVRDQYSRIISNVDAEVYRAADNILVESGTTDASGSIRFFLETQTSYRINFTKAGYDNYSDVIVPTQSFYNILMTAPATLVMTYHDITANLYPATTSFNNTTTAAIELLGNSSDCSITLCWLNTTFSNNTGTHEYLNDSSVDTCGCHLKVTYNLTNATWGDTVVAYGLVQGTDSDGNFKSFYLNRTYIIMPGEPGNYTITGVVEDLKDAFDPLTLMLMSILLSFMITVAVASRVPIGAMGSGLVFSIMLGMFTYYEMFPLEIFFLSCACAIAAIMIGRRY